MVKKTKGVSARRVLLKYTHYLAEAGALSKISLLITLHFFSFNFSVNHFSVQSYNRWWNDLLFLRRPTKS